MKIVQGWRLVWLCVLLMAGVGCSHPGPAPSEEPSPDDTASIRKPAHSPSTWVPSKGAGLKKRAPITVDTGDRLGWVDNAMKTYPPDHFITGIGIAPLRKTARQRALQELQKPFAKAIDNRIAQYRQHLGRLSKNTGQALDAIFARCRKQSLAIARTHGRVAEIFLEKTPTATVYALAVLERADAINQFTALVERGDRRLRKLAGPGAGTDRNHQQELLEAFICRESLDAALTVVKPGDKGTLPSVSASQLSRLLKK